MTSVVQFISPSGYIDSYMIMNLRIIVRIFQFRNRQFIIIRVCYRVGNDRFVNFTIGSWRWKIKKFPLMLIIPIYGPIVSIICLRTSLKLEVQRNSSAPQLSQRIYENSVAQSAFALYLLVLYVELGLFCSFFLLFSSFFFFNLCRTRNCADNKIISRNIKKIEPRIYNNV